MDRESKTTQGHEDSQKYSSITKCTVVARKHSEKCLNCVLCFVPGQTQSSVNDPTKLKPSCIEILPTFKLETRNRCEHLGCK